MQCSSPLHVYYSDNIFTRDGNKKLFFVDKDEWNKIQETDTIHKLELPCGHCIECRVNRAQDWSTRSMLESRYYLANWFVTLTYEDCNLPLIKTVSRKTGSRLVLGQLCYDHIQKFMKDLRKYYKYHFGFDNIRFLCAGEYGDVSERCHFHLLLFNLPIDSSDLHVRKIQAGHIYYDSPFLEKFWKYGNNIVTDLNLCTSSYVARYVVKKFYGAYEESYNELCRQYGVEPLKPEFIQTSRRPGIARAYFENELSYKDFLYAKKLLFENGKSMPIPKYFQRIFKDNPEEIFDFEELSSNNVDSESILDVYKNDKLVKKLLSEVQIRKSTDLTIDKYNDMVHNNYVESLFSRNII